jgi:hypothetical protein
MNSSAPSDGSTCHVFSDPLSKMSRRLLWLVRVSGLIERINASRTCKPMTSIFSNEYRTFNNLPENAVNDSFEATQFVWEGLDNVDKRTSIVHGIDQTYEILLFFYLTLDGLRSVD